MHALLHMGGHGIYVWCSYGLVAVILLYHYCAPLCREKKMLRDLAEESAADNLDDAQ